MGTGPPVTSVRAVPAGRCPRRGCTAQRCQRCGGRSCRRGQPRRFEEDLARLWEARRVGTAAVPATDPRAVPQPRASEAGAAGAEHVIPRGGRGAVPGAEPAPLPPEPAAAARAGTTTNSSSRQRPRPAGDTRNTPSQEPSSPRARRSSSGPARTAYSESRTTEAASARSTRSERSRSPGRPVRAAVRAGTGRRFRAARRAPATPVAAPWTAPVPPCVPLAPSPLAQPLTPSRPAPHSRRPGPGGCPGPAGDALT